MAGSISYKKSAISMQIKRSQTSNNNAVSIMHPRYPGALNYEVKPTPFFFGLQTSRYGEQTRIAFTRCSNLM